MTYFENELRLKLEDLLEMNTYYESEDDDDTNECAYVSIELLIDSISAGIPQRILEAIMREEDMGNIYFINRITASLFDEYGIEMFGGWYSPEEVAYYEANMSMYEDGEYAGNVIIRLKYNTTVDCEDIIQYKYVPYGTDENDIEFEEFHGENI